MSNCLSSYQHMKNRKENETTVNITLLSQVFVMERMVALLQCFDTVGWVMGHQTCKNRNNLYCVGADVKPCSISQSINHSISPVLHLCTYCISPRQFPSSTPPHWQKSPNVSSTFCTFSHTGSRSTFYYLKAGDILFRCFVSGMPASVESLSVHAYQSVTFISSKVYYTSDVTIFI